MVGGASANLYLRESFEKLCKEYKKTLLTAPLEYCSDNAAMVGRYGIDALKAGLISTPEKITVSSNRKLQAGMRL